MLIIGLLILCLIIYVTVTWPPRLLIYYAGKMNGDDYFRIEVWRLGFLWQKFDVKADSADQALDAYFNGRWSV